MKLRKGDIVLYYKGNDTTFSEYLNGSLGIVIRENIDCYYNIKKTIVKFVGWRCDWDCDTKNLLKIGHTELEENNVNH